MLPSDQEVAEQKTEQKEGWVPTQGTSHRLLNWLGGERKYEEIRRRLVKYFERRDCHTPDDLADDTLYRVMKWLEEHNKDYDPEPAKICYNTARLVFLEYTRRPEHKQIPLDSVTHEPSTNPEEIAVLEDELEGKEKRLACLEKCSQKLPADDLALIIRYYHGEGRVKLKNREAMAVERGMSASALTNKAFRIREKLRECVMKCMSE